MRSLLSLGHRAGRAGLCALLLFTLGGAALLPARAGGRPAAASPPAGWIIRSVEVAAGYAVFLAGGSPDGPFDLYSLPLAGGPAALLTAAMPALTVESFLVSGAGRVVFVGRGGEDYHRYLYSVPAGGGTIALLGPTYAAGVTGFLGSQIVFGLAGERVVFAVDSGVPNAFELYSAPAAGGPALRISPELKPAGVQFPAPYWVVGFAINDGDARQVVIVLKPVNAPQPAGFYAVPSDGSAAPRYLGGAAGLSDGAAPRLAGELDDTFDLSPDGRRFIYSTGSQLRSLAVDGSGDALIDSGSSIRFAITPDSARVVYAMSAEGAAGATIKSAPIGGGAAVTVATNARFAANQTFQLSPDGAWALYNDNSFTALLIAPVSGGPPRTVFAGPVPPYALFTDDGSRAVFVAGEEGARGIYSYAMADGRLARLDDPRQTAGGVLYLESALTRGRLIYELQAAGSTALRLYSLPALGGPATPLSGDLGAEQDTTRAWGAADGSVVFTSGSRAEHWSRRWRSLYVVPADGSAAPRLVEPVLRTTVALPLLLR